MNIAVAGIGYVGMSLAVQLAQKLRERGFDIPQGIYLIEEIKREIEKILGKGGA